MVDFLFGMVVAALIPTGGPETLLRAQINVTPRTDR
jgi:hypothetical protein